MGIIGMVIFLGILFIVISLFLKFKSDDENNAFKKIILCFIYFIIFFIAYYFIIAIISSIPLFFMSNNSGNGSDSGLWAYALILGAVLAPILSIITTINIIKTDKNDEATK